MSGYLQYSNYGDEDETPVVKQKVPTPTPPTQPGKPTQQKRILRTNQRTLRSRPEQPGQRPGQPGQQQPQQQQPQQHKYVQELIQNIHSYENGGASDSEDDDADNNYVPPAPSNNTIQQQFQTESVPNRNRFAGANSTDLNAKWNPAPAKEAFSLQEAKALASQYMPSMFQASTAAPENKDILLQKLDHIISLLEDQHDEKTGHVTEELVLYCFLGVFIIFIVDSFARAGKYVR
jgi:hypothetical protein